VRALVSLRGRRETDIAAAIDAAVPLVARSAGTRHVVLLTDGLHTKGALEEVYAAVQRAKDSRVSLSVIGIKLDKEGEALSRRITDVTGGRFFHVQDIKELDVLILEDYSRLKR
jgi:Mg-chelatase subunit ChlD